MKHKTHSVTPPFNLWQSIWKKASQVFPNVEQLEPNSNNSNHVKLSNIHEQIRLFFHSIRGPMNNTLLGMDLLEDALGDSFEAHEILQHVKNSCTFASDTLDKYAGLKRIMNSSKDNNITFYPFNLNGFFQQIEFLTRYACLEKNIKYLWNVPGDTRPWVMGDEHNLTHVFLSILQEAIANSPEQNTVVLDVSGRMIRTNQQAVTITIQYRRTCPSKLSTEPAWAMNQHIMAAHKGTLQHTFVPEVHHSPYTSRKTQPTMTATLQHVRDFFSVSSFDKDQVSEQRPSVMGKFLRKLSVLSLGSQTGGTVVPLKGANTFVIHIPFPICERGSGTGTGPKAQASRQGSRTTIQRNLAHMTETVELGSCTPHSHLVKKVFHTTYTVCVVDDSEMVRKMVVQLVNTTTKDLQIPTHVWQAQDGLEAIVNFYAKLAQISVIFMDNVMPTLTGPMTARLLRAMGYKNLIIGITGNSMPDDVSHFYEAGIDHLFIKPFTKRQMNAVWKLIDTEGVGTRSRHKLVYENDMLVWKKTDSRESCISDKRLTT